MGEPQRDAAIVIPCYNEERRLPVDRVRLFLANNTRTALTFVDDGSTDGTVNLIGRIRTGCEQAVTLLRQPRNTGKGEAVRSGLLDALGRRFRYVGFFDADLSTPLEAVSEFCAIMDADPQVAMVVGARVRLMGREIERRAIRHYAGRVFATAASVLLSLPIYDTQCGAKLFRATPELEHVLGQPFLSRWVFDVEIIARLIRFRRATGADPVERSIHEVPLCASGKTSGARSSSSRTSSRRAGISYRSIGNISDDGVGLGLNGNRRRAL